MQIIEKDILLIPINGPRKHKTEVDIRTNKLLNKGKTKMNEVSQNPREASLEPEASLKLKTSLDLEASLSLDEEKEPNL